MGAERIDMQENRFAYAGCSLRHACQRRRNRVGPGQMPSIRCRLFR